MQICLLAAGRGLRLGERTRELPKSLLPVRGKPFAAYNLSKLKKMGADEIIVVGGFEYEQLKETYLALEPSLKFVFNPDFLQGNLLSLMAARPCLTGGFWIFNADHLYSDPILKRAVLSHHQKIQILCDFDRTLGDDDMKVQIVDHQLIKIAKDLKEYNGGYMGVTCVPAACADYYWEAADSVLKEKGVSACVEQVLALLARDVEILDGSGSGWVELDTGEDLQRIEEVISNIIS